MSRLSSFRTPTLSILLALTLAACGKTPEEHFNLAQELVQKGDYKAAVIELKTVLQAQADNPAARQLLGEVFLRSEAYPQAEKELSRARSLGVPEEEVLPALAKVYVRMGEPQKALDLEPPAGRMPPRSLAALNAMKAEAHLALGRRADAETALESARKADPSQPDLLLTEAKLALVDGKKQQAAQLVDEALKSEPGFLQALYVKAALNESENKLDEAAAIYREIAAADAMQYRAHLALASVRLRQDKGDEAEKALQAAEKIAPKAPLVLYARGRFELQRGRSEKASNAFLEILRAAPDHLPSMLGYAMASYNLGNYEQSINYAGKVLNVSPANVAAARVLAGSQVRVGDHKGALKTINGTLPRHPEDPALLALAGDVHLKLGNYAQAMSFLDRAEALQPNNAFIKARRAAGHLATGDRDEALADLEAAAHLSDRPGQADLAIVSLHLKEKNYDRALAAIAAMEKKLPNNPVTHNLRAAALLGKKDRAGARKALEQALAIDPKFFPASLNLARLDLQDKQPERARKRFEAILADDPKNAKAMLALASMHTSQNQEQAAIHWFEKAARADPAMLDAHTRLVEHYLARKDTRQALVWAQEAVRNNPESGHALALLGAARLAAGDHPGAADTYRRLTVKAPRSAEAHYRLGLALIGEKKVGEAREALRRASALDEGSAKPQAALIRLELTENRPDAALQVARQMQAKHPKSPLGYDLEGDILVQQKRLPEAIKVYEQALANNAGSAGLIKLHRALDRAGDKSAEQRLQAWLGKQPDDVAVRTYAAEHYMAAGRDRDAIAQYEALVKLAPQNAVALNNLANLYQRAADKRALSVAEASHKLAPDHPAIKDTLGWILVHEGQLPRALELLGAAAKKSPKAGNIRYHYGVALARSGKKAEARKELEAALALAEPFSELDNARALLKTL